MTCGTHDLWCSGDLVEVFAQVCILQTNSSCCTCGVAALVAFMLQRVFRASSDMLTCKSLCNHVSICAPSSLWCLKTHASCKIMCAGYTDGRRHT